ncbi:MAG: hypothetical protein ABI169_15645 [Chitinophagaceae bacterium]
MAQGTLPQMSAVDAANLANSRPSTFTFGPLTISWNLDLSIPRITADATLYGASIGHVGHDTQHPTGTIGGSVGIAKAKVDLNADFTNKKLNYTVDVEAFRHVIVTKSGKLFTWFISTIGQERFVIPLPANKAKASPNFRYIGCNSNRAFPFQMGTKIGE